MKIFTTSVKLFYLDKDKLELHKFSQELVESFHLVKKVYLFSSLVRGDHKGFSNADLMAVGHKREKLLEGLQRTL
ncbi:MAG: nucleotidyltransferase domain-containing protein [Aquificaceae bacterium]|nr:nucleotidyltransferase domain-containing protein [Aquificaceae bacterium]